MITKSSNILIVDDEEVLSKLLRFRLSREGYHCHEADNGDQALDSLENNQIELVILDIKMQGKPGSELLPRIKESYPDTVLIMATGVVDYITAIQCMKQGALDYLTKPFDLGNLSTSVAKALEKRQQDIESKEYQHHLEQKLREQSSLVNFSHINAVTSLAYALEAKDNYTSGHSRRVAELSAAIAWELHVSTDMAEKIKLGGLVHDIGKIGVQEAILNKPARLTSEEYQQIKGHSERGEQILEPAVRDDLILKIVRHHHENFDGSGYPDGLDGEQIPLGARILAVADSFDAMTSERPYRKAMSTDEACSEIARGCGYRFDPLVASAFVKMTQAARCSPERAMAC